MVRKIVSGGQTGADRAALEVALERGLECGGWVPADRHAEDGVIPHRYGGLRETISHDPACRTRLNVRDSDATLIVCFGSPSGGTALTREVAEDLGRPVLIIDLERAAPAAAARKLRTWLAEVEPKVLNVAGPRASEEPRIYGATHALLSRGLAPRAGSP